MSDSQGDYRRAYVGLGSNLDSPLQQVLMGLEALAQLPQCRLVSASSLYRSAPVGPADQPDYVNAVALLETTLHPLDLLERLQRIEDAHGRVRQERWGPRTLDLDLLLVDNQVIDHPRLQVPHPEIPNRPFVLEPLYELWPEGQLPDGRLLSHLLKACQEPPPERLEL
jgi:2-amino-4-hydroxy-6-hydroxymethyldihydropteridine diphosphokinase